MGLSISDLLWDVAIIALIGFINEYNVIIILKIFNCEPLIQAINKVIRIFFEGLVASSHAF